jgi:hypothetical protein
MKKATQAVYKGVVKLLKAYFNNVFNGKVTTLVGVVLIAVGISDVVKNGVDAEGLAFILSGLGVAGFKDPGTTPPTP